MINAEKVRDLVMEGRNFEFEQYLQQIPGTEINDEIHNGINMLHFASAFGSISAVHSLLTRNADVNKHAMNNDGNTPLHFAARQGHLEICQMLVKRGAKVNTNTNDNETPLHLAAMAGHLEIVRYLISERASVNVKNITDETPLHLAAFKGYVEVAKALISGGANKNIRDTRGYIPLSWGYIFHNIGLVQLLKDGDGSITIDNSPKFESGRLLFDYMNNSPEFDTKLKIIPEIYYEIDGIAAHLLQIIMKNRTPRGFSFQLIALGFIYISAKSIEATYKWEQSPAGSFKVDVDERDFLSGRVDAEAPQYIVDLINQYSMKHAARINQIFQQWAFENQHRFNSNIHAEIKGAFAVAAIIASNYYLGLSK